MFCRAEVSIYRWLYLGKGFFPENLSCGHINYLVPYNSNLHGIKFCELMRNYKEFHLVLVQIQIHEITILYGS